MANELIPTSITLTPRQVEWIIAKGDSFNFSGWVRDRIEEARRAEGEA